MVRGCWARRSARRGAVRGYRSVTHNLSCLIFGM
ncbi:hypothetical protein SOVF_213040 [Spinacia oleracea]|nr:hypothetical protein SOVF_213040 [Spinacia oleracea]